MRCVVGLIVAMFGAATPRGVPGPFDTGDTAAALERLVSFATAGLAAPSATASKGAPGVRQEVTPPRS